MSLYIVTAADYPTNKPISLNLLKLHLNIETAETYDDSLLELYLGSAISEFESRTKRHLLTQTVRQSFDCFPCEDYFELEVAPFQELVSFQYYNSENQLTTVPADSYEILTDACPGIVQLKYGETWPTDLHPSKKLAVRITYKTGYGASDASVPDDIKRILSMIVGDSYL